MYRRTSFYGAALLCVLRLTDVVFVTSRSQDPSPAERARSPRHVTLADRAGLGSAAGVSEARPDRVSPHSFTPLVKFTL